MLGLFISKFATVPALFLVLRLDSMRSLNDWLTWLEQQHPKAIDLGLDRIAQVADRLQLRQLNCPVITVGGTNGKGSTVATLVSLAKASNRKVGSYTSPHLIRFNERICINGVEVADDVLVRAFEDIEAVRGDISLTYFEFTTLAAFQIFKTSHLDVAILEVGLGGRLDAVNMVDADVSVVTSIGLDHMDWLGNTRDLIGREKAGIYRTNRPAICGDREPPAELIKVAQEKGADLRLKGVDFEAQLNGDTWNYRDSLGELTNLPKPGIAIENAMTALAAWRAAGLHLNADEVSLGIKNARLSGRAEVVAHNPEIILDVAHNPHGAEFFMRQLPPNKPNQRTFAVFGILADKDAAGVLDACLGRVDAWFLGSLNVPRGSNWQAIEPLLIERGMLIKGRHASIELALREARKHATALDRIIVFGSFYTVGEARTALNLGE